MILQRLCEAAEQFDFPPTGYTVGPIKWLIDLDSDGLLLGFTKLAESERKSDRGKLMPHPEATGRTSGVKAQLLADKADYALGFVPHDANDQTTKRIVQCHEAFLALLRDCLQDTGLKPVEALLARLEQGIPAEDLPQELERGDIITFRVNGQLLVDTDPVREHWARRSASERDERAGEARTCLVCGKVAPIADRHLVKIKRVPGGQTSGCTIVSANEAAYESYGLEAALISPTCWGCARNYALALNEMLKSDRHSFRIWDQIGYVFWVKDLADDFSVASLLSDPDPDEVRKVLQSVERGRKAYLDDTNQFYALALSGSGGRVVIRDWLETTVGHAHRSIARYFEAQDIVSPHGQPSGPLGLMALMGALIPTKGRDPWKRLPPNLAATVVRAALTGRPLPDTLLHLAVGRARVERKDPTDRRTDVVTRPRAALIKMCLMLSSHREEGLQLTPEMNPGIEDPAYLCGRLLAILESIQRAAIPGAKATLVDRFYGTASSAPASVFGNLIRQAQAHLSKLRKTKRGAYIRLQEQLEEVAGRLPAFPNTLTQIDQGKFGLGYYQQRAADRAARDEAIAAKRAEEEETEEEEI